jgi:hypothetical protein
MMTTPPDDQKPQPTQEKKVEEKSPPDIPLGFFITRLAVDQELLEAYRADRETVLRDPRHNLSEKARQAIRDSDDGALRELIAFNQQVS